ncbi:potassium channel family protein [Micromonospora narathiwatensis]|uniref:Ion channel n=1 Tax=Micromonospora narathiwatensis TaxID=299146 RepID=A0A1A8Z571_9ACTN|nr:potassium channel family protein [Micromonospora narathiwatensis]SBT38940.1 Ion channel [Micromonospora narathiwatensis]
MADGTYRRERRRALVACLLLLGAYFLVPLAYDPNAVRLVLRTIGTVVVVVTVAVAITRQVRDQLAPAAPSGEAATRSLIRLAVALVAGVLAFALGDYVIATNRAGEFVGLQTRVDALYFALSTITTVGYGDVHAQGQIARVVVCGQMLFSIGVIATGASIVVRQLAQQSRPGRR